MSDLGNKDVFAKNLKYYMELNDKNRNDLCRDLNFKYSTVTDWINGNIYPRIDKIEMLANYFKIEKSDLIENKIKHNNNDKTFYLCPLYNEILPKKPYFINSNIKSRIVLDTNVYNISQNHEYFSIEVNENYTNFRNTYGHYIIFQKENHVKDDDIILIIVDNSFPIIKKYKRINDSLIMLQPIDLKNIIEPLLVDINNTDIYILGKAIGYLGKVEMNK